MWQLARAGHLSIKRPEGEMKNYNHCTSKIGWQILVLDDDPLGQAMTATKENKRIGSGPLQACGKPFHTATLLHHNTNRCVYANIPFFLLLEISFVHPIVFLLNFFPCASGRL